jgi:predicted alpha/beta superfamily hydrolase
MKSCFFILLLFGTTALNAQTFFIIDSLPTLTPEDASFYLAGNIGRWNPENEQFKFTRQTNGRYWLFVPDTNGIIEYKITRGSWQTVEGAFDGSVIPNRRIVIGERDTIYIRIAGWEDQYIGGEAHTESSSANTQVMIWDTSMLMPQLNRHRRIWVYLPNDYYTSKKAYKVLYMHDGQNVFDASTSFTGEWQVDETLAALESEGYETCIVVAVDNGGATRINEYSPFINEAYGGGEGDAYLNFLVNTLKPKIDSSFRTLPGPENTGIMGSSMGGLISHYGYFEYPDVFGIVGIFSPAYWFADEFFSYTLEKGKIGTAKIYLLSGKLEEGFWQSTVSMYDTLVHIGYSGEEVYSIIPDDGEHSEWFWAREFRSAFMWLFDLE